jgi:uncharacterized protein YbjQ (UPF0145 family)
MLLSTTPSLEGRPIRRYLGLVHGEAILGANLFRDLLASIRDLTGGRARAYERTLEQARQMALEELTRRARLLAADAVVGVRLDVEVLGQGGMLLACATGTAVLLEGPRDPSPLAPPPPPPARRSQGSPGP